MSIKPLVWVGSSRVDIQAFPEGARRALGYQLFTLQSGGTPRDWKPMTSVGPGVAELRVRAGGAYRLLFLARFKDCVYVLHVFRKKSRKTASLDLQLGRARLAAVLRTRSRTHAASDAALDG